MLAINVQAQKIEGIPGCNCSVMAPREFQLHLDTFETAVGKLIFHTYTGSDTALHYQLGFIDYPSGSLHSDSADLLVDFFRSTIDASVEKVKGIKKYESEIHQFGYPGFFWKIEFGKKQFMKTKAFVAGNRFYTLQVFGPAKQDLNKLQFVYFDSFKFEDLKKISKY